ncbi:ferredoxin [uncultured Tateyamaria sp.]|uniref:ferredoxin n=1 Tax=uncultured Tateyamaria sp. TaxID=455651 RepID=UPI002601E484|nr:ferredoxin [uncultured Tateyamaria sp.]
MTLDDIAACVAPHGLMVMGHSANRVLIGTDAHWWDVFTQSPEYLNKVTDPVDTWSKRILGGIARATGATAHFPSDGPPYAPFIAWALDTGRFWPSPTGMMVHDRAGLMISIRSALEFTEEFEPVPAGTHPCTTCHARPCVSACPVGALSADAPYDVPACKAYLDTPAGQSCMTGGCLARRACPVSQAFARPAAQSAFHMKAFVG